MEETTREPADEGRALQDLFKVQCFGCGALNERGLQIKSHWEGDELVCRWQPLPFHIGHPGIVYGGMIASVIDCHSIWTAVGDFCRRTGHDIAEAPPTSGYVTGKLTISYTRPADIAVPLELRARIVEAGERKTLVATRVLQGGVECASAEVVCVRLANRAAEVSSSA